MWSGPYPRPSAKNATMFAVKSAISDTPMSAVKAANSRDAPVVGTTSP